MVVAQSGSYVQVNPAAETAYKIIKAAGTSAVWPSFQPILETYKPLDIAKSHFSNRMGYMAASYDTDAATPVKLETNGYAGRVYGRLGQGEATLPGGSKPFAWALPTASASIIPGMQISIFPQATAMTAMITKKSINIEAEPKTFGALTDYAAPGQPGEATAPDAAIGASALLAATSTAAVALALATLY